MPFRSPIRPSLVLRSGGRYVRPVPSAKRKPIYTGAMVYEYLWHGWAHGCHVEHLWVLPMDRYGYAMYPAPVEVHRGTVTEVPACLSDVLTVPLLAGAPSFITVHNHPAGLPGPSLADHVTARAIRDAAKLLRIALYDDVIVADEGYYSFRESTRLFRGRRRSRA